MRTSDNEANRLRASELLCRTGGYDAPTKSINVTASIVTSILDNNEEPIDVQAVNDNTKDA